MRLGTTLKSLKAMNDLRAVSRNEIAPGDEDLLRLPVESVESLNINVSGTDYDVFVFGVDNPDDPVVTRYIP